MEWLVDHAPSSTPTADIDAATALIDILAKQGMDWATWVESDEQQPWVVWSNHSYPSTPYQVGQWEKKEEEKTLLQRSIINLLENTDRVHQPLLRVLSMG